MKHALLYVVCLLVIAFHEALLRNATTVLGISINVPALLVMVVALNRTELEALWFGFIAGIVMSAVNPTVMGWQALVLAALAYGAFHARDHLNIDSPVTRLSLIGSGVLLHNIATILINQPTEVVYQVWRFALTGALYSAAVATLIYVLVQSGLVGRRVRAGW